MVDEPLDFLADFTQATGAISVVLVTVIYLLALIGLMLEGIAFLMKKP